MSYAPAIEAPVPRGAFDLCDGPSVAGVVQAQPYATRWAAWVATAGLRIGQWSPNHVMDDALGDVDGLFAGGTRPAKVTICFDRFSNPVLAIQKDATTIEVKWTVSGTINTVDFAGLSPVLFFNGIFSGITLSVTDAVCFYVKTAGTAIFARFQRDAFATEYTVNASLPAGVLIGQLLKADKQNIGGVNYQTLRGITQSGLTLFLLSASYIADV